LHRFDAKGRCTPFRNSPWRTLAVHIVASDP
jgi:hypothetical protein